MPEGVAQLASEPSAFDLQAVLEEVVESAARLFGVAAARLFMVDGEALTSVTHFGDPAFIPEHGFRIPIDAEIAPARAVRDRQAVHLHDVQELPRAEWGRTIREAGMRTVLAV